MENLFLSMLLTSAIGTAFTLVLMLLSPITRKKFSAGWHYYMWLCVLLVMMVPLSLKLPEKAVPVNTGYEASVSLQPQETEMQGGIISVPMTAPDVAESDFSEPIPASARSIVGILSVIWLIGFLTVLAVKIIGYGVFIGNIRRHSVVGECPELSSYTKRRIKVRISNKTASPLIVGLIRPTLILPDIALPEKQLGYILAHEMTHLNRHDILYKWFLSLTECVHWFNPAIWLMAEKINADCEISCDMAVTKRLDDGEKRQYVETILALLSRINSKSMPLSTGMTGSKKTLKKRFSMIKAKSKITRKQAVISCIIAVVLLCGAVLASGVLNGFLSDRFGFDSIATDEATGDDFNLLFIGLDRGKRADTVILFEVYESGIKGTFIPRDTYISGNRIASIYSQNGGTEALINAVKTELATPVHYYLEAELDSIEKAVDLVGGINFNVPMDMEYSDPHQNLNIKLKQGYFTLTGEGATHLLQFRPGRGTHGDLSRIYIQQDFIKSFLAQKLDAETMNNLPELYKTVSDGIRTNLSFDKLAKNTAILTAVQNGSIILETLDGEIADYNGVPVYLPSDEIPIVWPTESTKISRGFEKREHPITGEIKEHNGVDIVAEEYSPVVSAIYGTVTETGFDKDMGNYVIIENDHPARIMYGHLADVFVSQGNSVSQQDLIGTVGKTGSATGPHLHFEMQLDGEYYDLYQVIAKENGYHNGIDRTNPSAVVNAFFRAFESGNYPKMADYCSGYVRENHFLKSDNGDVFAVFGMSMAKLRSMSDAVYLKGDSFLTYNVNVSCKTPKSFSILQSKNTFNIYLEKQEDGTYIISDISYVSGLPPANQN